MEAQTLESQQLERRTTSQDKPIYVLDKTTYLDDVNAAESSSKSGISELEKALYAQQQLLQKLYGELDQERESAATAASEALSMILRLQGEKASLKMEAGQYKRMAEEKMCHAEEALAVFEDLTYEREMEIAALEFQLQAYRYRLLSLGVTDLGISEDKFPENFFSQKGTNIRRVSSESGPIQENVASQKKLSGSLSVDLNSYWDQIKKLDERIKEISDSKDSGRHKSLLLKGITWSPAEFAHELHKSNAECSSSVQDIFEVPCHENPKGPESLKIEDRKLSLERDDRLIKPDLVIDEVSKKQDMDRLKKKTGKARNVGSHYSAEYQQLSRRIERLERAQKQEIGEKELGLLQEICVQIKTLQAEMKSLKARKPNVRVEPSLDPLQEAMLYFWL